MKIFRISSILFYAWKYILQKMHLNHCRLFSGNFLIKKWQWNLYQACIQEILVIDSAWKALTDESENLPREKSVSPLLKIVSLFARFLFSICLLSSFLILLFFLFFSLQKRITVIILEESINKKKYFKKIIFLKCVVE